MSRFAKIEEAAISRQAELTGEELRLYMLIKFHTWNDSGICRKNLRQLSITHGISYTHTTERYKKLKKLKWCEDTKKGIRPMVNLDVPESGTSDDELFQKPEDGVFQKPEHGYSENRNINVPESGTSDDEMFQKPEHPSIPYIEPFKDQKFSATTTEERPGVVVGKIGGGKSRFSIEDCRRYVALCIADGQTVRNSIGLANYLFETGEKDAFIEARLYPESVAETAAPPDETGGWNKERQDALLILLDLRSAEMDVADLEHYYSPADWVWLTEQLENVEIG